MTYQQLSVTRSEIRLLTLYSPLEDSYPISCGVKIVSLHSELQYTALSYCWGDPTVTKPIAVNGRKFEITVNLDAALRQARRDGFFVLWVDAICINQMDIEERSLQVRLMKAIYSKAREVIAWLGVEESDSDDAIGQLKSVRKDYLGFAVANFDTANTDPPAAWFSFDAFFSRLYWRRIWIIQEIAVATRILVYCGVRFVDWEDVVFAAEQMKSREVHSSFKASVSKISNLLSFRENLQIGQSITLLEAICDTQNCFATDRRDKIFALLGVTRDGQDLVPVLDYHTPPEVIYTELARTIIQRRKALEIITLKSCLEPAHDSLPSWVPNWARLRDAPRPWQKTILADKISGKNSYQERIKAMLGPSLYQKDNLSLQFGPGHLKVQGYLLDKIDGLTTSMIVDPNPYLERAGFDVLWQPTCTQPKSTIFGFAFDSYIAGAPPDEPPFLHRRPDGLVRENLFKNFFARAFTREALSRACPDFERWYSLNKAFFDGINTIRDVIKQAENNALTVDQTIFTERDRMITDKISSMISELLRIGMRLFLSEEGYMGIAHARACPGDLVCYIPGCEMLVIFRKSPNGNVRVVGEAYIHRVGKIPKIQQFNIV